MRLVSKLYNHRRIVRKKEEGSALVYLLFLMGFVAIVISVMLTTVTQGQQNVLNNQEDLEHFYRSEGALEAAVDELEFLDRNDRHELLNEMDKDSDLLFNTYIIDGHEMPVFVRVTKEEEPEIQGSGDTLSLGLTEQSEAISGIEKDLEILAQTQAFKVRFFDPKDSWTQRTLYRELFIESEERDPDPNPGEPTDPDPSPDPPPFSCPNVKEYLDPRGNRVILLPPPPQKSPDGLIYPANVAYVFEDCEYKRVFHKGANHLPAKDHILSNPTIKTDGILVIPKEMGNLNFENNKLEFYAKGGMYVGASLTTTNNKSIELQTGSGSLVLGEGIDFLSSNDLQLTTGTGHLFVSDAKFTTRSNGEIKLKSGGKLTADRSIISSSNLIELNSAGDFSAQRSRLESNSNGKIKIVSGGRLTANHSTMESSDSLELESVGDLLVQQSQLKSESNGDIKLKSTKGNIYLDGAGTSSTERTRLESSSKVEIFSEMALFASFTELIAKANAGYFLEAKNEIVLNHSLLISINSGPIRIKSGSFFEARKAEMTSRSWNDLIIEAQGNMVLEEAKLEAARDLLITSSSALNTIYVDKAEFRSRSNTAQASPTGIKINGTPKVGKISNQ